MKRMRINMKQLKLVLACLWEAFMAFITPVWIGFTYMFMTGNGKGYGYDLHSEADIYVMLAVIGIFIWLAAVVPILVWLVKTVRAINSKWGWIPPVSFVIIGVLSIFLLGWGNYLMLYGL